MSLAVLVLSCVSAFIGLEASSLWVDELFSTYFADTALPDLEAVFSRATEDTNPPGYYLLLWESLRLTGMSFVPGGRGLSALLAILAILALVLAPTKGIGFTPRLLAAVFVVATPIWFFNSQNIRAYALIFLLAVGMAASALRTMDGLLVGRAPVGPLALLAVLSLAASLSQYYAILLAGGLFTVLLFFCRSVTALTGVALSGLLVLVPFLAFMTWHQERIIPEIGDMWFATDLSFEWILSNSIFGLKQLVGTQFSLLILGVLIALAVWALFAQGPRKFFSVLTRDRIGAALALLMGSFLVAYLYAIAVTFAFTPIFAARLFDVLAPMAWVALAYGAHAVLGLMDTPVRNVVATASLSCVVLLAGTKMLDRGQDAMQPWRHSAEAVAAKDGCIGSTLPVVWFEQPLFKENNPERFYGFYLPPDQDRKWLPLSRHDLQTDLGSEKMRAVVQNTASGLRECTLLLWSVHMQIDDLGAVTEALAAHMGQDVMSSGIDIEIVRPRHSVSSGYLFVLQPSSTANLP
ncbi:MAG: hypothetical protein R8G34_10775 [Paracoccaceae bacterium]|nr:hypothetical protein [Paracoccaceae bacterium]